MIKHLLPENGQFYKANLHSHSTVSDGKLTPAEMKELYREAGYDAIAFTDHWVYGEADTVSGLPILAGAEYHVGARDASLGIYHILCLFADRAPALERKSIQEQTAQDLIDAIHAAGGLAVLAHPAWSLNTTENVRALRGIDGTEIFNTVSRNTSRADASLLVDLYATSGMCFPLFACDDFHHNNHELISGITPTSFIMVECDSVEPKALKKAIIEGRYYASMGPEIHLKREDDHTFAVECSPVSQILFHSNCVVSAGRVVTGEGLVCARYTCHSSESYIRASVIDSEGRMAWSQIMKL